MGCRRKQKVHQEAIIHETNNADFEQVLVELGAVKDGDSRLSKEDRPKSSSGLRGAKKSPYDDDSDWE